MALFGWILLVLISVVFLVTLSHLFLEIAQSFLSPYQFKRKAKIGSSLVSIHIPAYNEPPLILENTIHALKKLNYENYEVIVADNNTKDEDVWKPVEKYIKTLSSNFRFFHVEHNKGFKAGALNFLFSKRNPDAEYIATLDADYQVKPEYVEEALSYFIDPKVAFVQFPQSYQNVCESNFGIFLEYEYFFRNYMNAANYCGCVNATGTLTIFRTKALIQAGLYDISSITEDADIGMRLMALGFRGVFVNELIGQGLMPYDIEAYKKQKLRWSKGNAMTVKKHLVNIVFNKNIGFWQKFVLLSQLTAWLNLTLVPIAFLLVASFWGIFSGMHFNPLIDLAIKVASATLYFYAGFKFVPYLASFHNKYPLSKITRAYLIHIGMNWVYSTAFLRVFIKPVLYFERTNKFILPKMPSILKNTLPELSMGVAALILGILAAANHQYIFASSLLLIAVMNSLVYYVYREINTTKQLSAELMRRMQTNINL